MSLLKSLFGPSREEIWRQLAREVGGEFREAGSFTPYAVQARTDDWIITLDSSSHANEGITTLRAPFFNPEEFRFTIYRAGILSDVRWALKMQDIEVGYPRFDRDFVIKGNSPERLRRLFDNEKIRRLIEAQPRIHLSVQSREGLLSQFPAGVDELYFQRHGSIKDLAQLRRLFDLFAEILQQICHEGKAYEDDVRIHMRRLSAPGGRIKQRHILYDGDGSRRDAAAALGRLGDPTAIPALASVLGEKDRLLVVRAIEALAEIRAVEALLRLREVLRNLGGRNPTGRAISAAIRKLEARA